MFPRVAYLSTLALAWTAVPAANAYPSSNLSSLFAPSLSPGAKILLPTDANYTGEVTQRWTIHEAPTYLGAIKVATEADVQAIVRIATKNEIPFLATGGGHATTITLSNLKEGVEIDMSNLNKVDIDTKNNLVTVSGGTRFENVLSALYAAGREMQIGTATCVGMIGATLGGGVSSLQGHHGLLIDTLVSVRLITAAGDAITVSEKENKDLFWGIRGAGHNFGIITSATYKIFDSTNAGQVMNADFLYTAGSSRAVWEALKTFDNALPELLAINIVVAFDPSSYQLALIVNANYFGPEAEGLAYLKPFTDLKPISSNVEMVQWPEVIPKAYFGLDGGACADRRYINAYTTGLKQTDVATLETFLADLLAFSSRYLDIRNNFVIHRWPQQAVLAVQDGATVYPYRDLKMHIQLEGGYNATIPGLEAAFDAFAQSTRSKFAQTSGFKDLATYVNFAHGDEGPQTWYGQRNLGRLTALKKQWDPKQIFSNFNPIPLR